MVMMKKKSTTKNIQKKDKKLARKMQGKWNKPPKRARVTRSATDAQQQQRGSE